MKILVALLALLGLLGTAAAQNANPGVAVTPTDCSGTITTGGTAQTAITGAAVATGFQIMNIDTTEPLWVSFTGTAAAGAVGSYPLGPATATTFANPGTYLSQIGFRSSVSVVAATTGHKFSCTRW